MTARVSASASDPQLAETGAIGAGLLLPFAAMMLLGGAAIVLFGSKRSARAQLTRNRVARSVQSDRAIRHACERSFRL